MLDKSHELLDVPEQALARQSDVYAALTFLMEIVQNLGLEQITQVESAEPRIDTLQPAPSTPEQDAKVIPLQGEVVENVELTQIRAAVDRATQGASPVIKTGFENWGESTQEKRAA